GGLVWVGDGVFIAALAGGDERFGRFGIVGEIGATGADEIGVLVGYAEIGIAESALRRAVALCFDAFPSIDFEGEIGRAIGQGVVGGGAEGDGFEIARPAVVADNRADQRIFPCAAEAAIDFAIKVPWRLDILPTGVEDQA